MNRAYFVRYPRIIEDLQKLHLVRDERTYEVVKEITLAAIDYENFITDLVADRQFLEDNASLCADGEPMKCLLVRRRGRRDGVLVVPDAPEYKAFVKLAAYVSDTTLM